MGIASVHVRTIDASRQSSLRRLNARYEVLSTHVTPLMHIGPPALSPANSASTTMRLGSTHQGFCFDKINAEFAPSIIALTGRVADDVRNKSSLEQLALGSLQEQTAIGLLPQNPNPMPGAYLRRATLPYNRWL